MAISSSFFDTLFFCEEQDYQWDLDVLDEDEEEDDQEQVFTQSTPTDSSSFHLSPLDLFWEDEELVSLFTKEQEQLHSAPCTLSFDRTDPSLSLARNEAVGWILKVRARYGFTALTAVLSVNYLDRFLSSLHFQKDKPWMIQLVAVTCLSLAAKVEETQVPLLLDLQVEDTDYLFEAKTIQKMELLVMSTLKWKMNAVTPISFLDHTVRRLGLPDHLLLDFFKKTEALVVSLVSDSRFVRYKPSVLATAAMLHVIDQVDGSNSVDYGSQLLGLLKTTMEEVKECHAIVVEVSRSCPDNPKKRRHEDVHGNPGSPAGVMDFCCDENSNDSWAYEAHDDCTRPPPFKKPSVGRRLGFGSLEYPFVDVTVSPR